MKFQLIETKNQKKIDKIISEEIVDSEIVEQKLQKIIEEDKKKLEKIADIKHSSK